MCLLFKRIITPIFLGIIFLGPSAHAFKSSVTMGKGIALNGNGQGVVACQTCHGANGEGQGAAGFPALAGLSKEYLIKQILDFQKGSRQNPVMEPMVKSMSIEEVESVAAYYSSLPGKWNKLIETKKNELGRELAEAGRWSNGQPACTSCHGPQGQGIGKNFPPIAGQSAMYLSAQLKAWRTGTRKNDHMSLMKSVAEKMSSEDIEAVANYFAGIEKEFVLKESPKSTNEWSPPGDNQIPSGPMGDTIRKGRDIFMNTPKYSKAYGANQLRCANCHLDRGRLANASPMWAGFGMYPAYRAKNNMVNTIQERNQGCFVFSLNGKKPEADSEIITALISYQYWLAQGVPLGKEMPGRLYPVLAKPGSEPDFNRGKIVFENRCAYCHGTDGNGMKIDKEFAFPPLWGNESFNWGAGMHRINTAAGFIKANMPLGQPNSLTDQEAWDVSFYMNSHKRPADPRATKGVAKAKVEFHNEQCQYGNER